MLLTFWICFGANTLLNQLVFTEIIGDGIYTYPSNTREAALAIVAIWGTAYLVGVLAGLTANTPAVSIWPTINSVIAGYLLATLLHVFILGPFPNTPANSFGVLRDLVSLSPLPVYYVFILMTLVLGPVLVGVAVYTGYLVASEYPFFRLETQPVIYAAGIIFAVSAPLAIMLMIIGTLNACDTDDIAGFKGIGDFRIADVCNHKEKQDLTVGYQRIVRDVNQSLPFSEQETVPTILIFDLDLLPNPLVNALLALMVGISLGLQRRIAPSNLALSAGLGMIVYISLMLILVTILKPTTTIHVDYTLVYDDRLGNLRQPDTVIFATLWIVPPLVAAASAYATTILRQILANPTPSQPLQ